MTGLQRITSLSAVAAVFRHHASDADRAFLVVPAAFHDGLKAATAHLSTGLDTAERVAAYIALEHALRSYTGALHCKAQVWLAATCCRDALGHLGTRGQQHGNPLVTL